MSRMVGIVVAMSLALTGVAEAQRRPDMVLNKAVGTMAQAKAARRALVLGVECLLEQRPSNVRSFMKMYPDSKVGVRTANYLNAGDCVDGQAGSQAMRFGPSILRGMIFKIVYGREFGSGPRELGAEIDYAADAGGAAEPSLGAYVAARKFGECVVRRDPVAARKLVLAEVESEGEIDALIAMQPTFEACKQKDQPEMTRAGVTGVIAEVLYRLSKSGTAKNA